MSRGVVRRQDKAMSRDEVEDFLHQVRLGHFGTVGGDGAPYVVPNLFVFAEGRIWLHTTGDPAGHFRRNVEHAPRTCFEAAEIGQVYPYGEFACDISASYTSVVAFGLVRIEPDPAEKARFFDRFLAKYADPAWQQPAGFYPRLGEVTVYSMSLDEVTGKRGALPPLAEQWPAQNRTRSPGAKPPS
jgi:nitroimidazol reductase NimA-like FMN-containing flavoprotein (pyridoxamine 5'-phosphate oxidase superfamily)